MEIKAVIVEDSRQAMEALERSLELYCAGVTIVGRAMRMADAEHILQASSPDVAFLDIEMHDGRTTFELLDKLAKEDLIDYDIIFITGMHESKFTLKAFEMMALDYILKPIDGNRLSSAIGRVRDRLSYKHQNFQITQMLNMVRAQSNSQSMSIQLSKGDLMIVQLNDIKYIKGDGPISELFLVNRSVKSVKGLGYYYSILEGHPDFHKFSQSLLVNRNYMDRYSHRELEIRMKDGKMLEASRRGGQAFRNQG